MRSAAGRTCSLGAAWWAVDKTRRPFSSLAACHPWTSAVTSTVTLVKSPGVNSNEAFCAMWSLAALRLSFDGAAAAAARGEAAAARRLVAGDGGGGDHNESLGEWLMHLCLSRRGSKVSQKWVFGY